MPQKTKKQNQKLSPSSQEKIRCHFHSALWILYVPRIEVRAYTSLSKPCPNKTFPHQQGFFPIKTVTKSSTARFSHENLVKKLNIFGQDFVPIRTALHRAHDVEASDFVFKLSRRRTVSVGIAYIEHWGRIVELLWFSMGFVTPHLYSSVGSHYLVW